jgi:hypothetical protein
MAVIKRMQRLGRNHALLLTHDFLEYLGFPLDELEAALMRVEMINGVLIVSREGAPVLTPEAREEALKEAARRRSESVVLKDSVDLRLLSTFRLTLCNLIWQEGPMRPKKIIEKLGVKKTTGYVQIQRATAEGLIVKERTTYSLNPEYFEL